MKWMQVNGWPEYEVSDTGQVRGVERTVVDRLGRKTRIKQRTLKRYNNSDGYPMVTLTRPGKRKTAVVHRLLMEAFVGPRPDGMEVRHIDGDKWNCTRANLAYGTKADNYLDMVRHGTHNQARKTHCPHGHEYTPDNTATYDGRRHCRACDRERSRRYQRTMRMMP